MSARMQFAKEAWGDVPDFVVALVKACDVKGATQNKVAKQLGISGGAVSQIIHNRYGADLTNIEKRVRNVFMDGAVECPALSEIAASVCLSWRDRAKTLSSASPIVVRMFHQCSACPRNTSEKKND